MDLEGIVIFTCIFVSLGIGLVLGSYFGFILRYRSIKELETELDSKTRLLESYENCSDYEYDYDDENEID